MAADQHVSCDHGKEKLRVLIHQTKMTMRKPPILEISANCTFHWISCQSTWMWFDKKQNRIHLVCFLFFSTFIFFSPFRKRLPVRTFNFAQYCPLKFSHGPSYMHPLSSGNESRYITSPLLYSLLHFFYWNLRNVTKYSRGLINYLKLSKKKSKENYTVFG